MSYQQSESIEKIEDEEIRKHLAPWRQVLLEIVTECLNSENQRKI